MFRQNCILHENRNALKLHKKDWIFLDTHWAFHRKQSERLSFLGTGAYNAGIAQRCAKLRRMSKKTFVHFLQPDALLR